MRNLFLVLAVCLLGGYFRFSSSSSAISQSDMWDIKEEAEKQSQRKFCRSNFYDVTKDDVADLAFDVALTRGYDVNELNTDGSLDDIDDAADQVFEKLEGKCAHVARLNNRAPLYKGGNRYRAKSPEQKAAEQTEKERKFNKVLGIVRWRSRYGDRSSAGRRNYSND